MYNAGCNKFFNDIGITELGDQYDLRALLCWYYMENEKYDTVNLEEFSKGCKALGCDDLAKWKAFASGRAAKEIKDQSMVRKVYLAYFKPARDEGKTFINCTDNFEWYHSQFFTSKMLGSSVPKCNYYAKWIEFSYTWGAK
jgi:hypothetical protein